MCGRGRDVGRSLDLHTDAKKGGRGRRDACGGEGGDENGCNNGWRFLCTGQHYKNLPRFCEYGLKKLHSPAWSR